MKVKKLFQHILLKIGNVWLFSHYVKKHRLDATLVNALIRREYPKSEELLIVYLKNCILEDYQMTEMLFQQESEALVIALRQKILNHEQQEILVNKKSAILLEAYLCPKSYFDASRRFGKLAEYLLIDSFVKSSDLERIGAEIAKIYIDNAAKDLLTDDILQLIMKNDGWAARYILEKCRLGHEQEDEFIEKAPQAMLENYLKIWPLWSESAQLKLIKKDFVLAERHFQDHGLRCEAEILFHARRKERAKQQAENQTDENNPSGFTP
ncbi:MAG: hypothetical protein J6C85_03625 [Alphaproteobacteria bacterium]|nr:hypothetical protein [Alphaproteobacteria bacterium]